MRLRMEKALKLLSLKRVAHSRLTTVRVEKRDTRHPLHFQAAQ